MSKHYQGVGWYSANPHNPHITPFARIVRVTADSPMEAYDKAGDALDALYLQINESVDFLNWYIEEVTS